MPTYDELKLSEWSNKFEQFMRNRLIMGAFRYGKMKRPGKPKYDRVTSMRQRLDLYELDGNMEILVDVANLCMVEFVEENHPKAHWKAQDDGLHPDLENL